MISASNIPAKIAARRLYRDADIDFDAWDWLSHSGVDLDLVTVLAGPIVRRSVSFIAGGMFEFDPLGDQALCLVAHGEDAVTEIDLVAFAIADPSTFGTLLGRASILGVSQITNPSSFIGRPCPLWRSPMAWLRSGCEGGVILRAIPAAPILSKAPGRFIAQDLGHARELVRSGSVRPERLVVPVPPRVAA